MKFLYTCIFALVLLNSCSKDPLYHVFEEGSEWNNERSIKDLVLAGQIGMAEITNTNEESLVAVMINPEAIEDWGDVPISYLGLSWGATAPLGEGSSFDLSSPDRTTTIEVSSETGLSREWTIVAKEFQNPVAGSWMIKYYRYSYDDFYGWGNSAYDVDLYLKMPESEPGLDDLITFGPVEGVTEGRPYGSYHRSAGANETYASYVYQGIHNFTPMYGQVPAGKGTYYLDQNGDGETILELVMDSGNTFTTHTVIAAGDRGLLIHLHPTMRDLGKIDWDNYYAPYTSFVSTVDIYYDLSRKQ